MAGRFGDINLTKYDDLFKDEETRQAEKQEQVLEVPADQIFPYARQPYTIDRPTPDLVRLMDSVERFGIMEPMVVRPVTVAVMRLSRDTGEITARVLWVWKPAP